MKKKLLIGAGILAGLMAVVLGIGALLPKEHTATRQARYKQSPEAIWQAITEAEKMPQWRTDVKAVRRLPEKNGMPGWVETLDFGDLPLEATEMTPPRRLVMRIATEELPFGGTWTYELAAADGVTTLRITENGEIRSPVFRFMAHFVFGYSATIEDYLRALGKKFGEEVTPAG